MAEVIDNVQQAGEISDHLNSIRSSSTPSMSESNNAKDIETKSSSLPEISDEHLLKLLEEKKLKIPTKIDGKEEFVDFNELRKGYSHQSAASKRYNEAMSVKQDYESRLKELYNLAQKEPQKLLEALGVDKLYKQEQPEQELSPAEKRILELEKRIEDMNSHFSNLSNSFHDKEVKVMEKEIRSEFNQLAEKYPHMKNDDLQRFAAFQMYQNPNLKTEDVFKSIHELIDGTAKKSSEDYIKEKKNDASKQVLGAGNTKVQSKSIREIKDPAERLKAILDKAREGGY